MQKHLILSLVLALGMVAMCAPTGNPGARKGCPKTASQLSRSTTGRASHPIGISSARATNPKPHHFSNLVQRAGGIKLCEMSLRNDAAMNCQGEKGFVFNKLEKKYEWKEWDSYKHSTDGLHCEHLVELQLVKSALINTGFCNAWNGILNLAANQGHVHISDADKERIFAPLKAAANDRRGLRYVDGDVNGKKRAFFGAIIDKRGSVHMTLPINSVVLEYMKDLKSTGTIIASTIDHEALEVLKNLVKAATSSHAAGTSDEDVAAYDCLVSAQIDEATGYENDKITAVSKYWEYVLNSS